MKPNPSTRSDDPPATAKNLDHSAVTTGQKAIDPRLANKQLSAAIIRETLNLRTDLDRLISRAREDKDSDLEPDKDKLLEKIAFIIRKRERAIRRHSRVLEVTLKASEMLLKANFIAARADCDTKETCEELGGKWCDAGPCPESEGNWCDGHCIDPDQDC